jgi:hypothetical protein
LIFLIIMVPQIGCCLSYFYFFFCVCVSCMVEYFKFSLYMFIYVFISSPLALKSYWLSLHMGYIDHLYIF